MITTLDPIAEFRYEHNSLFSEKVKSNQWILLPALSDEEQHRIDEFSNECAILKVEEELHKKDKEREYDRIRTGKSAEASLRKYLNLPFPDLTLGPSYRYPVRDISIKENDYGIKCSKLGQAALVFTEPRISEIILIKSDEKYYLCGVANINIMKNHNDKSLIKSANNSKKAGLTIEGYKSLLPLKASSATDQLPKSVMNSDNIGLKICALQSSIALVTKGLIKTEQIEEQTKKFMILLNNI